MRRNKKASTPWAFYGVHSPNTTRSKWFAYVILFYDIPCSESCVSYDVFISEQLALDWISEQKDKIFN